jgi:hypothetical protein
LDWSNITIQQSGHIHAEDALIEVALGHHEVREDFDVIRKVSGTANENVTILPTIWSNPPPAGSIRSGDWTRFFDSKQLVMAFTGEVAARIDIDAYKCRFHCPEPEPPGGNGGSGTTNSSTKRWSLASSWASN